MGVGWTGGVVYAGRGSGILAHLKEWERGGGRSAI